MTAAPGKAYAAFHAGFNSALKQAGIAAPAHFDPLTYPAAQQDAVNNIIQVINHNRSYDNDTGYSGHVVLTDSAFRPIVGLSGQGGYEPLDYRFARQNLEATQKPGCGSSWWGLHRRQLRKGAPAAHGLGTGF